MNDGQIRPHLPTPYDPFVATNRYSARGLDGETGRFEVHPSQSYQGPEGQPQRTHSFDANAGGYMYAKETQGQAFKLPGLWFTPNELQALAVMQRLLKDAGGGLLEDHLGPLAKRLSELMKHQHLNLNEAASRLRFPSIRARPAGQAFDTIASARPSKFLC